MDVFQSLHIPRQALPKGPDPLTMRTLATCYPPLGQVTVVESSIALTVLLEIDETGPFDTWEVSLWYSEGEAWRDVQLALLSVPSEELPSIARQVKGSAVCTLIFTTTLTITAPLTFTIKFRNRPQEPWKWVKDSQGTPDGMILPKLSGYVSEKDDLRDLIGDLNPAITAKKVLSQSPNTSVWVATTLVGPANGEKSSVVDIELGRPWHGKFLKWFALVRIWSPWLAPRHGQSQFALDRDAMMCSFMDLGGRHLVLLAISGIDDTLTLLQSDNNGNIIIHVQNDREKPGVARLVIASGTDFESANAAAMYHARLIVHDNERATGEEQNEVQTAKDGVKTEWMENWFDGLSYCTWNGLGQRLTDQKVFDAVDTLAANNINITNLIIDDNWQSIDYRGHGQFQHGWIEFEADRKTFPDGLKKTISKIRESHKHIQHIAVWHAILGYWAGLAPDGKIANAYKTTEVVRVDSLRRNLPMGGKMTVVAKEDAFRMYDDFYSFLSDCGIDAVKTDAQFMLDTLDSATARRDLFTTYLDAWTISSLKHFSIKAISCMSQVPQIIFHSQLPQNRPAILVRNSDDFFPEIESSHPWHIFANAHNSLLTQHLNSLPDWDMFQTVHDYSGFHAASRCVSGGPIYITDVPGHHDIGLINQMTGQTTRGRTVIFRPNVGKSLDAYVGYDDEVILKVGTYHGMASIGTSIIGLFNISQRALTELLPLSRFMCIIDAQYYVVRSHRTGLVTKPMQVVDSTALIPISLATRGYDILSAYPLRGFVSVHDRTKQTTWIANLGLLGKMTGAAAIVSSELTMEENGRILISTSLKALGILGLYMSNLSLSFPSFLLVTIQGRVIPVHTVSISKLDTKVLEIDLEAAWGEMGLDAGWSNEVSVQVYINSLKV